MTDLEFESQGDSRLLELSLERCELITGHGPPGLLRIEGWAITPGAPKAIHLTRQGAGHWHAPVSAPPLDVSERAGAGTAAAGFRMLLSGLALPHSFELGLHLRLADGGKIDLGVLRGARPPVVSSYRPALQPLIITSLGRSGSTAVVHALSRHPEVIAYRPTSREMRVASYWMSVLRVLAEPASYLRQINLDHVRIGNPTWWTGFGAEFPAELDDAEAPPLQAQSMSAVAALCQERIDSFYCAVAEESGKPGASRFVEKMQPHHLVPVVMADLYERSREVFIVRDFRDVLCSMRAYTDEKGGRTFARRPADSDADWVARIDAHAGRLAANWRERSESAFLLRYESFVMRPAETLTELAGYLEIDSSQEALSAMADVVSAGHGGHGTSRDAEASIGRWRKDLSPELQEVCERELAEPLAAFGYE